jgi:uroporphyrinogen-III decarboxylase
MGHAVYSEGGVDFDEKLHVSFEDPEAVLNFDPVESLPHHEHKTLIERFEKSYKWICEYFPDAVNMTGVYITCISGLIELLGWENLLLAAGIDPEKFGHLTNRYAIWVQKYFDALAESDVPVVMVHDDITWSEGAFIHPDWYRKYVFPNYKKMLAPLKDSGKIILFTSDANYTEFLHDIVACGVNGFVMEPLTDLRFAAEHFGQTCVLIGNADTRILLHGSKSEIRAEVERCMDIGKKCPGFFMAVGNHIPPNTPIENAVYYNEVYEEMSRR